MPVAFVSVGEEGQGFFELKTNGNQTSYMNRAEAELLADTLASFLTQGKLKPSQIGEQQQAVMGGSSTSCSPS